MLGSSYKEEWATHLQCCISGVNHTFQVYELQFILDNHVVNSLCLKMYCEYYQSVSRESTFPKSYLSLRLISNIDHYNGHHLDSVSLPPYAATLSGASPLEDGTADGDVPE